MKRLYTKDELLSICQQVAEKVSASSYEEEHIRKLCEEFDNGKLVMDFDNPNIEERLVDDNVKTVELLFYKAHRWDE